MQKRLVWILVAALIGLTSAQATAQSAPPVSKVGILVSFTGALAEFGPAISNSVRMAAAELNAAATEVLGGPIIELVEEDSATVPSQGIDRANKLVQVDGVVGIIGALSSAVTVAVAESVAIPNSVVVISPASTSPYITFLDDEPDVIFRTTASDTLQGVVAAMIGRGEIFDDVKYERAAVMYVNNPYGQGLSDAFSAAFEARGGTITATVAHPDEPQPTYAAQLEQLFAGDPEVVLSATYPGQATVFKAEARDLYGFTNWQYTEGTASYEIRDAVGADVIEGSYGTQPGADPGWTGWITFRDNYVDEYGPMPNLPFLDTSYDGMASLGLAIAQAIMDGVEVNGPNVAARLRTVANAPGTDVGVGDFQRAMELMKAGTAINYSGAAGEVDYDEFGDVVTAIEVFQWQDGEMEPIAVVSPADIPAE